MNKKTGTFFSSAFFVILVTIGVVLYVITLGQYHFTDDQTPNRLESRYRRLTDLIERKTDLKRKLERILKHTYFVLRMMFIGLWVLFNMLLINLGWMHNELGAILNFHQVILLVALAYTYIRYGRIVSIKELLMHSRMKIEIWAYKKYLPVTEHITRHEQSVQAELEQLDTEDPLGFRMA